MASLGSFGAAVREFEPDDERDTFEFFGETFTVEGIIPPILDLKLSAALAGKLSATDSDAVLYEALRYGLTKPEREADGKKVPADDKRWQRFYELAAGRKCHPDDLVQLVVNMVGAQAGRPTERRSTSEPGSSPTSTSSSSSASDTPDSPVFRPVSEVLAG